MPLSVWVCRCESAILEFGIPRLPSQVLLTCLPAYLPACMHAYLHACLPACLYYWVCVYTCECVEARGQSRVPSLIHL